MTAIELRLFFESLPDHREKNQTLPTKREFTLATQIRLNRLQGLIDGRKVITPAALNKLLPVMRKYGFQG